MLLRRYGTRLNGRCSLCMSCIVVLGQLFHCTKEVTIVAFLSPLFGIPANESSWPQVKELAKSVASNRDALGNNRVALTWVISVSYSWNSPDSDLNVICRLGCHLWTPQNISQSLREVNWIAALVSSGHA
jgi:hypothetical protein